MANGLRFTCRKYPLCYTYSLRNREFHMGKYPEGEIGDSEAYIKCLMVFIQASGEAHEKAFNSNSGED